jgi:hypothetical protein
MSSHVRPTTVLLDDVNTRPRGFRVLVGTTAANSDEETWPDPEAERSRTRMGRRRRRHRLQGHRWFGTAEDSTRTATQSGVGRMGVRGMSVGLRLSTQMAGGDGHRTATVFRAP